MSYHLPDHGESNWDTELNASLQYLKDVAESAETPAAAQSRANAAQAAAIDAASSDATSKAAAAQAAAITAASTDATTKANSVASAATAALASHAGNTSNPHGVTKAQVGLGNVPNVDATARANHTGTQAISTVTGLQSALDAAAASGLTKGTITTGDPGSDADISITGTPPNQVLNMTIPGSQPIYISPSSSPTSPTGKPNNTLYFEYT